MASRSLSDLHPKLKPVCESFISECEKHGVDVLVYCTWRSDDEQNRLYEIGRSKPGRVVTNARAGQSAHNYMIDGKPAAKAFDCCPLIGGKAIWDGKNPAWQIIGKIGIELGLEWYGAPGSKFFERPHFQLKG